MLHISIFLVASIICSDNSNHSSNMTIQLVAIKFFCLHFFINVIPSIAIIVTINKYQTTIWPRRVPYMVLEMRLGIPALFLLIASEWHIADASNWHGKVFWQDLLSTLESCDPSPLSLLKFNFRLERFSDAYGVLFG